MDLKLTGVTWTQASIESSLILASEHDDQIRVESPFRVTSGDTTVDVDPEQFDGQGNLALPLLGAVSAADASDDGTLVLVVGSARLEVPPDDDYEAWSLIRADGSRVVCMPGGELAVWSAAGGP